MEVVIPAASDSRHSPPTCVVADEQLAVAEALALALGYEAVEIVACVASGQDALDAINALKPDVAVLDVGMQSVGGLSIARQLAIQRDAATALVFYADHAERELVLEAIDAGARGFVLKQAPLDDLFRAVRAAARGESYVDPGLGEILARGAGRTSSLLSERERAVLRLLADGMVSKQIGKELAISTHTVRTYVRRATEKLGADTRTQAVAVAMRRSIIR